MSHFRSKEVLALAEGEHCTIRTKWCIGGPCVSAHSNQSIHGKGKSIKAEDCFIAFSCDPCHREIDQGKNLTRAEKIDAWDRGHRLTLPILFRKILALRGRHTAPAKELSVLLPKIVPRKI